MKTSVLLKGMELMVQSGAPKIAFSLFITPITMVYGTYNYSYWGESKPTYNWGASHCSWMMDEPSMDTIAAISQWEN